MPELAIASDLMRTLGQRPNAARVLEAVRNVAIALEAQGHVSAGQIDAMIEGLARRHAHSVEVLDLVEETRRLVLAARSERSSPKPSA